MPVDATSTLMKNHVAGRVLPAQRQLAVAYSDERSPFLFALDDAHRLTVTRPSQTSATGWAQIDLSAQLAGQAGLGAGPAVQCFAVSQQADGSIWLVVAAADSPGGASRILLSRKFGNKLGAGEWTSFAQGLVPRANPDGARFTSLVLGNADDDGGAPHIVGAALHGGMVMHYQINPDPADTSWTCEPVPLPQNASECLAATAGNLPDLGRGVYALCRLESLVSLTFTTLPQTLGGEPYIQSRELALPAGYTAATKAAIAALPTENGLTELYLSGNGLHRFDVAAQTASNLPAEQIADAALLTGTTQLAVAGDAAAQGVDVWALNEADVLVYAKGTPKPAAKAGQAAGYTWQLPLCLAKEVTGLAVYRVPGVAAEAGNVAAAALGRADGSLSLIGKDTVGDLWLPQSIALEAHDAVVELNTYTTRITVTDADGARRPDTEVSLLADTDVAALVNGQYYNLKSKVAKSAKTDAAGVLTIVLETADLSAPVYTVGVDGATQHTAASKEVVDKLRGVTTGTQIAEAKRTDGKALFPDDDGKNTKFDAAAAGIQRLVQVHDDLAGQPRPRARRRIGPQASASPAVVLSAFGVRHVDGAAVALHGDEALAALAELGDDRHEVGPGELLWALWSGAQEIGNWFVNQVQEGWEFIVYLAGKAMKFVFEFAAQAVAALDWVLQHTLGISLEDMMGWLGYLFNWDDILRNHKVLAHIINLGFDHTVGQVLALTGSVHEGANKLRQHLLHDKFVIDQSNAVLAKRARKAPAGSDTSSESPEANWAGQQMAANGGSAAVEPVTLDDFTQVLAGLAKDEAQIFVNAAEQFQRRIVDRFDQLTWGEVMTEVLDIVGAAAITTLENVAITFLEAVAILLKVFKQLINARWNIPVLTYVYEQIICRGDGSKLTVLDLIALLATIPATVLCKAVSPDHRDLFSEATATAVLGAGTWDGMLKALTSTAVPPHRAPRAALAAAGSTEPAPAIVATMPFHALRAVLQAEIFILSVLGDNAKGPAKDTFATARELSNWTSYVLSLVNLGLTTSATANTTSARYVIDSLMTSTQVLVRVKETYLVLWKAKVGTDAPGLALLSGIEAFMGFLMFVGAIASDGLQIQEKVPEGTTPLVFGLQTGFKCSQNISSSFARMLAPVALLPDDDPRKKLGQAARTVVSFSQALSTGAMAAVNIYNVASDIY